MPVLRMTFLAMAVRKFLTPKVRTSFCSTNPSLLVIFFSHDFESMKMDGYAAVPSVVKRFTSIIYECL